VVNALGRATWFRELQKITRDAAAGKRLADKLFKVWRANGKEAWLLIHVEVQGQRERKFAERMFKYYHRILDRYDRPVVSLAVLCDEQRSWRPDRFVYNNLGCNLDFRFPMVKLIDYRRDEAALEQSANPFAAVILAQLKVLETRHAPATRWQWKLRLVKGLYDRGLKRQQVRQLFRVLDWMLALPSELEQSFRTDLERFEEARRMPYVTSIERLAREEGLREGLQKGIESGIEKGIEKGRQQGIAEGFQAAILALLERRFKKVAAKHVRSVRSVRDIERLKALLRGADEAETLDEVLSPLRDG
jgi:hypothetical protein